MNLIGRDCIRLLTLDTHVGRASFAKAQVELESVGLGMMSSSESNTGPLSKVVMRRKPSPLRGYGKVLPKPAHLTGGLLTQLELGDGAATFSREHRPANNHRPAAWPHLAILANTL